MSRALQVLSRFLVLVAVSSGVGMLFPTGCRTAEPLSPANTVYWDGAASAALRAETLQNYPRYREVFTRLRKNAEISRSAGRILSWIKRTFLPVATSTITLATRLLVAQSEYEGRPSVHSPRREDQRRAARQGRSRTDW